MKNKRGFTLIELLVTIVIMMSILGIAIVSVNKISESRKVQAYESVKDQVVTAAKEYFNNNEYLINQLSLVDGASAYISVGTLVKEDYLNVLTDPRDNTKVDDCDLVVVSNNKYSYVEKDSDAYGNLNISGDSCIMDVAGIVLETYEPSAPIDNDNTVDNPSLTVEILDSSYSNFDTVYFSDETKEATKGWFNSIFEIGVPIKFKSEKAYLKIGIGSNSYISESKDSEGYFIFEKTSNNDIEINDETILTVKKEGNIVLEISYYDNETAPNYATLTLKIDRTPPQINLYTNYQKEKLESADWPTKNNSGSIDWYSGYAKVYASTTDSLSGPKSFRVIRTGAATDFDESFTTRWYYNTRVFAEGTSKYKVIAQDKAGNKREIDKYYVKLDRTLPTMKVTRQKCEYNSSTGKYSNCSSYSNNTWINKWVKTSMTAEDNMSGINYSCYTTTGTTTNTTCDDSKKNNNGNNSQTLSRGINAQGISYISYKTCDMAGNCQYKPTDTRYTIKLDRTSPKIISFTNTQNKNCKTSTGKTCYYSHEVTLEDPATNAVDVSGLSEKYKYNHCYDNAEKDGATGLICEKGFKSDGNNFKEYIYTGGYDERSYKNNSFIQYYTYKYYADKKYYNLFYKIYDNAGNSTCYRYKLNYTDDNKYTTAKPVWVSGAYHCDDN